MNRKPLQTDESWENDAVWKLLDQAPTAAPGPRFVDDTLRAAWGLGPDDVAVIYVGRVAAEKNLELSIRAFRAIQQAQPTAKFVWVGDGPLRERLAQEHPDFLFCGVQRGEALARHFASGDLFLFSSHSETFGNVTLEAMACARPVVAAAATGSESLVDDGASGRLIRPGAIHQFAEALRAYIEQGDLRTRHGAAGEARAMEFSWDRINQAVADTYLRLIRQRAAARR